MKPFNLAAAMNGAEVVTRKGVSVTLWRDNNFNGDGPYTVFGIIHAENGDHYETFTGEGLFQEDNDREHDYDLLMATKTVTLYTPIYADERGVYHGTSQLFPLEKSAHDHAAPGYVAVAAVTFEV